MNRAALILLAALAAPAFAQEVDPMAQAAQDATAAVRNDAATTGLGLALGFAEGNPIGLVGIPIRLMAVEHCKTLPDHEAIVCFQAIEAASNGAAISNLATLAFGPVGLVFGATYAVVKYQQGAPERARLQELAHMCSIHREVTGNAALKCDFRKVPQ